MMALAQTSAADYRRNAAALRAKLMGKPMPAPVRAVAVPAPAPAPAAPIKTVATLPEITRTTNLGPKERARLICKIVARDEGLKVEDIMGERRWTRHVKARHLATWLVSKANPNWTWGQLGEFFNKDHTSIIWAVNKMEAEFRGEKFVPTWRKGAKK